MKKLWFVGGNWCHMNDRVGKARKGWGRGMKNSFLGSGNYSTSTGNSVGESYKPFKVEWQAQMSMKCKIPLISYKNRYYSSIVLKVTTVVIPSGWICGDLDRTWGVIRKTGNILLLDVDVDCNAVQFVKMYQTIYNTYIFYRYVIL